jgi:hypothetical protein
MGGAEPGPKEVTREAGDRQKRQGGRAAKMEKMMGGRGGWASKMRDKAKGQGGFKGMMQKMKARKAKKQGGDKASGDMVSKLVDKLAGDSAAKVSPGLDQAAQGGAPAPQAAPPPDMGAAPAAPPPGADAAAGAPPPAPGMKRGGRVVKKGVKKMAFGGLSAALKTAMAQRGQAPQAPQAAQPRGWLGNRLQQMMQQRGGNQTGNGFVPGAAMQAPQPGQPTFKKGGVIKSKKGWEGSKKDEAQDKKLAKKYGMSMSKWEKSSMDAKHDRQRSTKGLARGGGIESRGRTRGAVVRMASGGLVGSASRRADGIASKGRTRCKMR